MKRALLDYDQALEYTSSDECVFLDATFALPNNPVNPQEVFKNLRIGNARFFDIEEISDHENPLPHMLPTADFFAQKVGALGISNNTKVIIYGQNNIAMGPARAWWMFHVFGHTDVHVLNGSLLDWHNHGYPVATETLNSPVPQSYKAFLNRDLVKNIYQVTAATENQECLIIDARPPERYSGIAPEPRLGMRAGHIPGSINIPAGSLINAQTGGLRENNALRGLIPSKYVANSQLKIMSCGSGVTACLVALAFYELGDENFSIYDGSWSEYGMSEYPVTAA